VATKTLPQVRAARKPQQQPARHNPQAPGDTPSDSTGYLATAWLKIEGGTSASEHIDAINWLSYRALAIAKIVEEASYSDSESEFPQESLRGAMAVLQEDLQVAQRLANGLHGLYCEATRPKAD
jgi:hypothetical protein